MPSSRPVACFTVDHLDEGTARLLDVFERREMTTTVFVEGRHGEERPEQVADVARRGHELGMHGWAHEQWDQLPLGKEKLLATQATNALERASGVRPKGFRAPGGARTEDTAAILSVLGYRYDASLGDGMHPSIIFPNVAQVPFVWNGVDGAHYLADPPPSPADVEREWTVALERVGEKGGLYVTVCHGFITGADDDRLAAFDRVVGRAQDGGFDLRTAGQVAEGVLAE